MTLRVLIYGSCVTRDAVEFWDAEQLEMAGYVARQSLISAAAPPSDAEQFRLSQISSSFQRRMLRGDVESSLLPTLEECRDDYDVILWDLTDERNGVQQLPDGGWVTRLRNFQKEQLFRGIAWRSPRTWDAPSTREHGTWLSTPSSLGWTRWAFSTGWCSTTRAGLSLTTPDRPSPSRTSSSTLSSRGCPGRFRRPESPRCLPP